MNLKPFLRVVMALLLLSSLSASADTLTRLNVWTKDGEKVSYDLTEKPCIKFADENLSISIGENEALVPMSKLSHFTYDTISTSDIQSIEKDGDSSPEMKDGALTFDLKPGKQTVEIYDVDGRLVHSYSGNGAEEYRFPLSRLQSGLYIVNANGFTYKILKK